MRLYQQNKHSRHCVYKLDTLLSDIMQTMAGMQTKDFWPPSTRTISQLLFVECGAHHQNGIVERRIRLITETARTLLLHAQRHWPEHITTMLWPFAVKAAIERINYLSFDLEGKTPANKFF